MLVAVNGGLYLDSRHSSVEGTLQDTALPRTTEHKELSCLLVGLGAFPRGAGCVGTREVKAGLQGEGCGVPHVTHGRGEGGPEGLGPEGLQIL